jgi:DNA-binding NarL/FixJ family response regulator
VVDNPIRVLVVEDHHVVRKGLVALLELVEGLKVVGEAADGIEAVTQFHLCKPDITLTDLRLPGQSGVEVIRSIRRESKQARFIVLTTYDGDEDIYRALEAGAKGYLLKGATGQELVAAIRLVHEGKSHVPPEIYQKFANRFETEELTDRETEVLEHIVDGRSNREIGNALDISEATVKSHVNNLLNKLRVSDRTQAATSAIQRGLVILNPIKKKL